MSINDDPASSVIPVHAEALEVVRRRTVTGTLTVATRTTTREEPVDEWLVDESAHVERVPCNRMIDEIPAVRHEGEIVIVPVVEKVVVIQKRLLLKEEVRIGRTRVGRRLQEKVVLRSQDVEIVRDMSPSGEGAGEAPEAS